MCYGISNIFIGSCSIFLWLNIVNAFSRNAINSIAFFFTVKKTNFRELKKISQFLLMKIVFNYNWINQWMIFYHDSRF